MNVELVKRYQVEAAHATHWHDNPARLHGHSFEVDLVVQGACDDHLGWLIDYAEISRRFDELYQQLDHKTLNDIEGIEPPTVEGLRKWIYDRLKPRLDLLKEVRVSIRGEQMFAPKLLHPDMSEGLPERVRFGFEAAHALRRLPAEHKCSTMHGHSFVVEVGAGRAEPLITRLVDVYEQLDHRCLNDVPGLDNPTSEEIARWIWSVLAENVVDLEMVSVAETCAAKCVYYGQ